MKKSTTIICLLSMIIFLSQCSRKTEVNLIQTTNIQHIDRPPYLQTNPQSCLTRSIEISNAYVETLFDKNLQKEFLDKLLNNPAQFLKENLKLQFSYKKGAFLTSEEFERLNKKNPLWLLSECDANSCPMNRLLHPQVRHNCIEKISNNFKQTFNKNNNLIITFFAPGGLFSELILLTKLIRGADYKKIRIILIDRCFGGYTSPNELKDSLLKVGSFVPLNVQDANPAKQNWLRGITGRFAQFIHWLSDLNTQTKLTVNLYKNCDDYIYDCIGNDQLQSDAIIAFDYFDQINGEKTTNDLLSLQIFGLKIGGKAYECGTTYYGKTCNLTFKVKNKPPQKLIFMQKDTINFSKYLINAKDLFDIKLFLP